MVRSYRYRLTPTKAQDAVLRDHLHLLCEVYNSALQSRRDAWQKQGVSVSYYQQQHELLEAKQLRPELAAIHSQVLRDPVRRVDGAFKSFFRRVKSGLTPGYPRFKSSRRYCSFTFPEAGKHNGVGVVAGGKRIRIHGVGNVKLKLHRPIEGSAKTATILLDSDGHWYVVFACDNVPMKPLPETGQNVGVDVGLTHFATLSTGEVIENPRPYQKAQEQLADASRVLSRRQRGSNRRRKARQLLAKVHAKVARIRRDHHFKMALCLVRRFDRIIVEALEVASLTAGKLAKSVHDAGWAQFISILKAKAEEAGREVIEVNPRGTSQLCSGCGAEVRKTLSVRTHDCPKCGLLLDRDHNAALNIQLRGPRSQACA